MNQQLSVFKKFLCYENRYFGGHFWRPKNVINVPLRLLDEVGKTHAVRHAAIKYKLFEGSRFWIGRDGFGSVPVVRRYCTGKDKRSGLQDCDLG